MENKHQHSLWLIAIVAIVAIVAIMTLMRGKGQFSDSSDAGNLAGQGGGNIIYLNCTDTDGGINYLLRGTATVNYLQNGQPRVRTYDDRCATSGNGLTEYYCNQQTRQQATSSYNCPYGCANGACLNAPTNQTNSTG